MQDFMQAMGPNVAPLIGDLFAKQADWPGTVGEEVSARLYSMLPPQAQMATAGIKGKSPEQAAMFSAMQSMQKQFQDTINQLQGQLQQMGGNLQQVTGELRLAKAQLADRSLQWNTKLQEAQLKAAGEQASNATVHAGDVMQFLADMQDNLTKLVSAFGGPPPGGSLPTTAGALKAADAAGMPTNGGLQ